ncbi:MAG: DNA-directed RNA polymerase subunit omega [Calditrichaeota bacterium]|nr:DNA-directed RNA polymerase subunit omega [Calditrichota bacterium]
MAETLPIDELEKRADNIYEAIVMISQRARQINDMQKKMLEEQVEAAADEDEIDGDIDMDRVDRQYLKLPKPTTIALQEMMEGKLSKEYLGKDDRVD